MFEALFYISIGAFLGSFFYGIFLTSIDEKAENSKFYTNLIRFMTASIFTTALTGVLLIISKILS